MKLATRWTLTRRLVARGMLLSALRLTLAPAWLAFMRSPLRRIVLAWLWIRCNVLRKHDLTPVDGYRLPVAGYRTDKRWTQVLVRSCRCGYRDEIREDGGAAKSSRRPSVKAIRA